MNLQQKTQRGPVMLSDIHSSGRTISVTEGKNFYFDQGIPGEEIIFTSGRRRQGFRWGEITAITRPSVHRVSPYCQHYLDCNGCNWQHIEYDYQLILKHKILCDALVKYGVDTPDIPSVIASPQLQNYRHRTEYTFSSKENILGFHNGVAGEVSHINQCFLQQEISTQICDFIRSFAIENNMSFYNHELKTGWLRSLSVRRAVWGEIMVVIGFAEDRYDECEKLLTAICERFPEITSLNRTLHLSESHSQMQGVILPAKGMKPYLYEKAGNFTFRVHATSFFQPNVNQAVRIFNMITEWADLKGTELVYDLYTGVGTIALSLASTASKVIGIEGSSQAIEDATENARINGIHNTVFMTGDILETFKPEFLQRHGKPDVIVLDPPRSGTLIEIKKTINSSGASKVIYVSCNPVSLAFDLKQLTEAYRVKRIQPFDMLPHTHHLETLVLLERK